MVIIGLVGSTCSGKTMLAEILRDLFKYNIIKLDADDTNNSQLLDDTLKMWSVPTVVYPINSKSQIDRLSKRSYFHVIWLDGPILLRYKRKISKYGEQSLQDFVQSEDQNKFQNRLIECVKLSKVRLNNQFKTKEEFESMVLQQREKIDRPFRPSWEVYFMKVLLIIFLINLTQIAYVLKSRSNCMKKSVGAVLVDKYNRIISTSYNGTPKVMTNCNEGGCDVCNNDTSLKLNLYKCWCIHAEEGCILEAGVFQSRGASLYTTLFPCVWCCKALVQAGVEAIYYDEEGEWNLPLKFLGDQLTLKRVQISNYIF